MRFEVPFIRLPLLVDAPRLAAEVMALPDSAWQRHPEDAAGNTAVPLVAAGGDINNATTFAAMAPTPHLASMPYTRSIMAAIGAPVGRSRLMRIEAEGSLHMHVDVNRYWQDHMRVHVPVITHPDVAFKCVDDSVHMSAGEVWVFDTWRRHGVDNPAQHDRIHLVIDTVGSSHLWHYIDEGQRLGYDGPATGLLIGDGQEPVFERSAPLEITPPWHHEALVNQILDELGDNPPADFVTATRDFLVDWKALWSVHRDNLAAADLYRGLIEKLGAELAALPKIPMPNGLDAAGALRELIVRPGVIVAQNAAKPAVAAPKPAVALAPTPIPAPTQAPAVQAPAAAAQVKAVPARESTGSKMPPRRTDRPVFIVNTPRSGSTLMFETLAKAKNAFTIGGESHEVFERIPSLHPSSHDWNSNALDASDVTPDIVRTLEETFIARAHDRDQRPPIGYAPIRLLEKTPKNALRIPFLAEAFPDGVFVYLHREPHAAIGSIIDAWQSGRFVTYPQLPGWEGLPWSLLLTPDWQEWRGMPIAEIAARQWATTTSLMLDALEQLPPDRWCTVRHEDLLADPNATATVLCEQLGFIWDRPVEGELPASKTTLEAPKADKWRKHEAALEAVWHLVAPVAERAERVLTSPPVGPHLSTEVAKGQTPLEKVAPGEAFKSSSSTSFASLLQQAKTSVIVTTYQSGRVVLLRPKATGLNTHLRAFRRPMGVAVDGGRLALGTTDSVWQFMNHNGLAKGLEGGPHDACFVPHMQRITGDIAIHEMAYGAEGRLWLVSTKFSCLATLDGLHSFVPQWKPSFITKLAGEDRCHLNGMAMKNGQPAYVTAMGVTDEPQGWRATKVGGGIIIDVASHEIVATGLTMPHSPRWHNGKLWVLDSGQGTLCTVDLDAGRAETVVRLPGFTRGLTFIGPYALVGLSKVREHVFAGLPLSEHVEERMCGVWVVDTRNGEVVAFMRFDGAVEEVFDVQLLPGLIHPELLEPGDEKVQGAFLLPEVPAS